MTFPASHRLASQLAHASMPAAGAAFDTPYGLLLGWGDTVPAKDSTGYAHSAIFLHTDGETPGGMYYQNFGSVASSDFQPAVGGLLHSIEEVVDLTDAGAKFVAMSTPLPAGAAFLGAQANLDAAVTAGGTTVKIALGINDGDVDAYGKTTGLTQNLKIDTIPLTVLSAETTVDVCGVVADGSALGDSNLSAGKVRVRLLYLALKSLADAA